MAAELKVQRLHPDARLPTRSYPDDAGLDLYALEPVTVRPLGYVVSRTGIAIEMPAGHVGLIVPRSGNAARGLTLVDAPAVIDPGYRGELRVQLHNVNADEPAAVEPGDRLAQLLVLGFTAVQPVEIEELGETARGGRGLGSSGR